MRAMLPEVTLRRVRSRVMEPRGRSLGSAAARWCWRVGKWVRACSGCGEFAVGDEGDADFAGGYGGDVGLAVTAPVDFDEVGPGSDGVVLAEAESAGAGG